MARVFVAISLIVLAIVAVGSLVVGLQNQAELGKLRSAVDVLDREISAVNHHELHEQLQQLEMNQAVFSDRLDKLSKRLEKLESKAP